MLPGMFLQRRATSLAATPSIKSEHGARFTHNARLHELWEKPDERASNDDVHRECFVDCEIAGIPTSIPAKVTRHLSVLCRVI